MLVNPSEILTNTEITADKSNAIHSTVDSDLFKGKPFEILKKKMVNIPDENQAFHYVTNGDFSMSECLLYCLKLAGPSDIFVATWSISELAIRQLLIMKEKGFVKSCQFILDPRVKVRNPKPLQLLQNNFPFAYVACHAKVSLIKSDKHHIDIVSSANLSRNPRIERGVIYNNKEIFDFDKKWMDDAFNRRTT